MRLITSVIAILVMVAAMGAGCSPPQSSGERQAARDVEQNVSQAYAEVGSANITNFQELKFAVMIQELRDKEITTWTYTVNRNGDRRLLCESVGFGLPYSTQTTNPMQSIVGLTSGGDHAIPQAEPNALYMPDNVAATWVLCNDGGEIKPVYSEPALLVSPFRLDE